MPPKYVQIVRGIIPKAGIELPEKPSRVKRKVVKALNKARLDTETVRGVGIVVGDHGVVYRTEGDRLFADIVKKDSMQKTVEKKSRGKRKSQKGKRAKLFPGPHVSVQGLNITEYTSMVLELIPGPRLCEASNRRWKGFDMNLMLQSGATVQQVADSIISHLESDGSLVKETGFDYAKIVHQLRSQDEPRNIILCIEIRDGGNV